MWQMPKLIGAVDATRAGSIVQFQRLLGGAGPNTASAAPSEEDPERLNKLLGELGVPAVGQGSAPGNAPQVLITPDNNVTPEQARALIEQQSEEALKKARKPAHAEKDSDDQARS